MRRVLRESPGVVNHPMRANALYSRVPDKDESLNEQRWFPEQVIVLPFSWIRRCFAKIRSSNVSRSKRFDFVRCRGSDLLLDRSKYSRSIYFYNNNISTSMIWEKLFHLDCKSCIFKSREFLRATNYKWFVTILDPIITIRCDEVLRNQTDMVCVVRFFTHELLARTSFFLFDRFLYT